MMLMDFFYAVLLILMAGLILVGVFTLGMLLAVRLLTDAQDDARYDRLREEYYRMAGFKNLGDPKPYVPPQSAVIPSNKTPRNRILPGMSKLDRLMHEGKRGTVMWRPEDRQT